MFFPTGVMSHGAHFDDVPVGVGNIDWKVHVMLFGWSLLLEILWNTGRSLNE